MHVQILQLILRRCVWFCHSVKLFQIHAHLLIECADALGKVLIWLEYFIVFYCILQRACIESLIFLDIRVALGYD